MLGKVEDYLKDKISTNGSIHITLIDPEKVTPQSASTTARDAESWGTSAIMIGGSTFTLTNHLDRVVKAVKRTVKAPIVLFPNNVSGISRYADAIWFMSLLNSSDPYFIFGAQVLGAPLIRKFGLEAIPLGYIVVGEGGTVGVVGRVCAIPYDKPELVAAHALAAQYLGMRFVYLEAGSGAKQPVPNDMVKMVKDLISVPLIVGGGIKTGKQAKELAEAGADILVTGTVTETPSAKPKLKELIGRIKNK